MSPKRRRPIVLFATLAVAIAVTGCGGSSHSSSTALLDTATAPSTPSSTTTTAPVHKRRAKPAPSKHHHPTTTTTTTASSGPLPPPPAPSGPDGLRVPSGYATAYDNCQGACGGAVPTSLRRSLRLPAAGGGCHVSGSHALAGMRVLGSSPVGPVQPESLGTSSFINSAWAGARVTWAAASSYSGPVLIRGRQIGGTHAVGFGEGNVPVDELQLLTTAIPAPNGAREWPSFTRVRAAGCYAYQIDGTSFSAVVVFRAT